MDLASHRAYLAKMSADLRDTRPFSERLQDDFARNRQAYLQRMSLQMQKAKAESLERQLSRR